MTALKFTHQNITPEEKIILEKLNYVYFSQSEIEVYKSFLSEYSRKENKIQELLAGEDILFDRIAELESELACMKDAERWIPVEERLPEEEELILIFGSRDKEVRRGWYEDGQFQNADQYLSDVTHWKPLPEPPKE